MEAPAPIVDDESHELPAAGSNPAPSWLRTDAPAERSAESPPSDEEDCELVALVFPAQPPARAPATVSAANAVEKEERMGFSVGNRRRIGDQ
jgi:hypothetical protein